MNGTAGDAEAESGHAPVPTPDQVIEPSGTPAGRRYAAFISYSHADAAIAGWVQRRLETYRLPRGLAAARGGSKLGPIFRDREDLAAATSLPEAILEALTRSDALLVLCSPAAKQSRWVNEEIVLFRTLYPDRPILAAIVDGEPDAAMPEALTSQGREPLAADLRAEGGDGKSLGRLKIVAALAEVPLDTLIQRDARRDLVRVMAITGVVAVLAIILSAMTIFAIRSRDEAQRQRAAAEGLVEYMLTDLRSELIGVGRVDVRSGVYDRAMSYYTGQGPVDDLPEDSLERRARVLLAMGEDEVKAGQAEAAARRYIEAYRTTAALLARDPDNAERLFNHAQSTFYMGDIARRNGRDTEAHRYAEGYLALAIRLQRVDRDQVRALRERAYAEGGLCVGAAQAADGLPAAIERCRAAMTAMVAANRLRPDDAELLDDLGNRHSWLADVLAKAGQMDEALDQQQRAVDIARRLRSLDEKNFDRIELLASRMSQLSALRAQGAQWRQARLAAGEASALYAELLRHDPGNTDWQRWATVHSAMVAAWPSVQ